MGLSHLISQSRRRPGIGGGADLARVQERLALYTTRQDRLEDDLKSKVDRPQFWTGIGLVVMVIIGFGSLILGQLSTDSGQQETGPPQVRWVLVDGSSECGPYFDDPPRSVSGDTAVCFAERAGAPGAAGNQTTSQDDPRKDASTATGSA